MVLWVDKDLMIIIESFSSLNMTFYSSNGKVKEKDEVVSRSNEVETICNLIYRINSTMETTSFNVYNDIKNT